VFITLTKPAFSKSACTSAADLPKAEATLAVNWLTEELVPGSTELELHAINATAATIKNNTFFIV
jgi:hypothetical protein